MTQPTPDLYAAAALALDARLAHCGPGEFGYDIPRTPPWTRADTYRLAVTTEALLAEVQRLREERDSALSRAEMSGEQTVAYEAEVERLRSGQPWEELFRQRDEAIAERDRLRAHILDIDAHATARDLATAYSQLITEHDRLMARRAELILSGVDPGELLMPEVPLPLPGDGDG